jgi:hypothetical protein
MKAVLTILLALLSMQAIGQQKVVYDDIKVIKKIGQYVSVLEDTSNKLSIKEVVSSNGFKSRNSDVPNLGVTASTFG